MKRHFIKKPVLAARAIQVSPSVSKAVTDYIQRKVDEAGQLGFIDGDYFAFCQDEAFSHGYISKCMKAAQRELDAQGLDGSDEDDVIDALYDSEAIKTTYNNVSSVVRAFRAHGKEGNIPEWYFD